MCRWVLNIRRLTWHLTIAVLVITPSITLAQTAGQSATRVITRVRGDLYRVQDGTHTTVFLVTAEGILLVDPLNVEFARWLRTELDARFPNRPVKWVVYSSVNFERVGGGGAFKPPAEIVAKDTFGLRLRDSRRTLPAGYAAHDRNTNGALEPDEAISLGQPDLIPMADRNADGRVSADELWSGTLDADGSYARHRVISLGGTHIELLHTGPALGISATAVYFPQERAVFANEHPSVTNPLADRSVRPVDIATWTRTIVATDFDTLVAGNGDVVSRDQVVAVDEYVGRLAASVAEGYEAGRSVTQLQSDSRIDRFAGTPFAVTRNADIAFLYQHTHVVALDGYGVGMATYTAVDRTSCGSGATCQFGAATGLGGSIGGGVSIRKLRVAVEVSSGSQLSVTQEDVNVSLRENSRAVHLSVLGGYRTAPSGTFTIALLGGLTSVSLKTIGLQTARRANVKVVPTYTSDRSVLAFTFGADIAAPMGRRFGLIAPVRLTKARPNGLLRSGLDIRLGVGLTVTAYRRGL